MKRFFIVAMAGLIVACGGGTDNAEPASAATIEKMKPAELADKAIADLKAATTLLAGISTVEAAEAAIPQFKALGDQYAKVNAAMRTVDQSDSRQMMKMAEKSPLLAAQLQAFMGEVNAIQSRNSDAAQILLPHLRTFSGQ